MKSLSFVETSHKISIGMIREELQRAKSDEIDINGLSIQIKYSKCNFGGSRPWFVCPGCGNRKGTLFCPNAGSQYLCRDCHGLRYWDRFWKGR